MNYETIYNNYEPLSIDFIYTEFQYKLSKIYHLVEDPSKVLISIAARFVIVDNYQVKTNKIITLIDFTSIDIESNFVKITLVFLEQYGKELGKLSNNLHIDSYYCDYICICYKQN